MTRKRIFIIGPAWPLRGGIAATDELLCKALTDAGHSAEIVSFTLQYPSFLFPGTSQFDTTRTSPAGMQIRTLINSVNPFNWLRIGAMLRKEKPDLVIIRFWIPFLGPSLGTIARRIRKNGHTRIVALTDNAIPHEKRLGDHIFTKYFLKSCDGFLAMSKSVVKDLETFQTNRPIEFSEHPLYTSFGVSIDKLDARKQLGLEAKGKYLLFFGLIRKYKGLDILLEALADERLKERNVQLIIAGEYYEDPEYYTKIIEAKGLSDRLQLHTKYIPDNEVKLYFSACDLVTLTYHTATQSGVAAVSMNFDKPSLVTNVGGLSEIIEHNKSGYVVEARPEKIADSIADYYDNAREIPFTEATRIIKKKFSWETMVETIDRLDQRIQSTSKIN